MSLWTRTEGTAGQRTAHLRLPPGSYHGIACRHCDATPLLQGAAAPWSAAYPARLPVRQTSVNTARVHASSRSAVGAAASTGSATSVSPTSGDVAKAAPGAAHRIDVHHHIMPPRYMSEEPGSARIARQAVASLFRQVQAWTPAKSIEEMDRSGVATSITSVSAPGVWFGDVAEGRRVARDSNEYGARLMGDYPGRFGAFASIPLPDIDGSLREIEYALDVLKCDGIVLMTSYGDQWPGDAGFAPVFDELNRRKAVVYFHPTVAPCCTGLIDNVPDATIEFLFDTVRAVTSLLYSGTFSRCPDIRFIFSHAGSAVPLFAARICRLAAANPKLAALLPNGPLYELKKLHYELAQTRGPESIAPLMQLVTAKSVMLGSDFPWTATKITETVEAVAAYGFSAADIADIERGNALRLFPRLAG